MIIVRKSNDRGHTNLGWLNSKHTFSFGHYYDSKYMGLEKLRVINDDKVLPGEGFGTHPHKNMEIISYVLEGELAHKDSMGNGSVIYKGDVQRMSAGTGVTHSEFNNSNSKELHFLQIWFLPNKKDIMPSYEQKSFTEESKLNNLKLIVSSDGKNGSISINQDVNIYNCIINNTKNINFTVDKNRAQWLHVATGDVIVNDIALSEGDGIKIENEKCIDIKTKSTGEFLIFDILCNQDIENLL